MFAASVLMSLSNVALADQQQAWLAQLEQPKDESARLKPQNELNKYSRFDFSTLLTPRSPFLGYVGDDFKRLHVYYTSISKSPWDDRTYFIKALAHQGDEPCRYAGELVLEQVREFESLHYGLDEQFLNSGLKAQGLMLGRYSYDAVSEPKRCGRFEGLAVSYWVLDSKGVIQTDAIEWYSDSYRNNQHVGLWIRGTDPESIVANWGERRIPFSEALDMGAGEFSADPLYRANGWDEPRLP